MENFFQKKSKPFFTETANKPVFILFIRKQCYNIIFNSTPFIFNIYICEIDFIK